MYEGLHTNLPCVSFISRPICGALAWRIADEQDLMAFRDFEFPDDTPAFPDRGE